RLDGSFWLAEYLGDLRVRQIVDVAEDESGPVAVGQGGQERGPAALRFLADDVEMGCLGGGCGGQCRMPDVERDGRCPTAGAGGPTPTDRDRGQPASHLECPDPVLRIGAERAVRPNERVLGDLLGIRRVAEEPEADAVDTILVGS